MAEQSSGVPELLELDIEGEGAERTVRLRGELDVVTSPNLREAMLELIDDGARTIIVDMSGLELIDSTGLGVLVGVLKRVLQYDGELKLRAPTRHARKVFDITGLDRVFTIVD